jgi:hypothetical protein
MRVSSIGPGDMVVIETLIPVEIGIEARRLDHRAGERRMEIGVEIDLEIEAEMQRWKADHISSHTVLSLRPIVKLTQYDTNRTNEIVRLKLRLRSTTSISSLLCSARSLSRYRNGERVNSSDCSPCSSKNGCMSVRLSSRPSSGSLSVSMLDRDFKTNEARD